MRVMDQNKMACFFVAHNVYEREDWTDKE